MPEASAGNDRKQKAEAWTDKKLLIVAFLLRLFLIFYARVHDYFFELNFTDIDYVVFSDAAFLVSQRKSPYVPGTTYRYTPLIAWLLVPNRLCADFGKLLFAAVDVLVGWFQLHILYRTTAATSASRNCQKKEASTNADKEWAPTRQAICLLWLFNPFNAVIAARGSSDSLICFLVLLSLYTLLLVQRRRRNGNENGNAIYLLSALIHGAGATHLRIFPIIYLPSIFLHLSSYNNTKRWPGLWSFAHACLFNKRGFLYVLLSLSAFAMSTALCFLLYGRPFLDCFLLYHLALRRPAVTRWLSTVAFVPQLACIVAFALKFSNDLPFCWFLTTLAFVSFNKVSTSQYFIWYLCLLPLVYPRIRMTTQRMTTLFLLWLLGQAHWLLAAYLLEFRGWNTFLWVWAASLLFLAINCAIMVQLIRAYCPPPPPPLENDNDKLEFDKLENDELLEFKEEGKTKTEARREKVE